MWFRTSKVNLDSSLALLDANKSLKKVKARTKEVTEVSDEIRLLRERNHFAEQLRSIMRGP